VCLRPGTASYGVNEIDDEGGGFKKKVGFFGKREQEVKGGKIGCTKPFLGSIEEMGKRGMRMLFPRSSGKDIPELC